MVNVTMPDPMWKFEANGDLFLHLELNIKYILVDDYKLDNTIYIVWMIHKKRVSPSRLFNSYLKYNNVYHTLRYVLSWIEVMIVYMGD